MSNAADLTRHERLIYNLAGHGVVGFYVNVHVELVTVSGDEGNVKYAPIREICDLRKSPRKYARDCGVRYTMFILGGMAGELMRIEKHHKMRRRHKDRAQFLKRWVQELFDENPFELEMAISTISASVKADSLSDVTYELNRLWDLTYELVSARPVWSQVERIAKLLHSRRTLSGQDVFAVLRKHGR